MDKKDYVKILYESNPIGEYGIILQLTTFDIAAWKRDQNLKQIPIKTEAKRFRLDNASMLKDPAYLIKLNEQINSFVVNNYEQQILDLKQELLGLKQELEFLRNIKIVPMEYGDKDEG